VLRASPGRIVTAAATPAWASYRVLVTGQRVPAEFTDRLVDQFLAQVSPPG
jgi:hypothetical protein